MMYVVKSKISTLATLGMLTVVVLSGCASQPNQQKMTTKAALGSPKVVMNAQGVPNRYLVKQGDTISKIAVRYGLDWQTLGRINHLDAQYTIYVGQWLTLWQDGVGLDALTHQRTSQHTQQPKTTKSKITPAKPAVPTYTPPSTVTSSPSVGSVGLMQFRYPVSSSNPVVRRFGTTTINGQAVNSQGMWFSGRAGDAVLASRKGTVLHADGNIDGAMIAIAHADGFVSNYFHIQNAQVKAGQTVQAGQQIATMRGQENGTALLEFRIARNSSYVDPLSVLK
ncbi:M23 family metallopeptidase [Moraxella sp. Tifton1]|uniref:M23 family metallopeptidase n=1 Tax=Moraxella oculi TaxID=2940516 RepID=UPI002013964B|nr:M23 family metallopeptidase [Moraxella sp. Tifton1]MCL1623677.1 M23 family metallopeptidase [Moraxella sp. Tifton1]